MYALISESNYTFVEISIFDASLISPHFSFTTCETKVDCDFVCLINSLAAAMRISMEVSAPVKMSTILVMNSPKLDRDNESKLRNAVGSVSSI